MAFSLRKMLSNISYFTKPGEDENHLIQNQTISNDLRGCASNMEHFEFDHVEANCIPKCTTVNPNSIQNYTNKQGSHSDTDLLCINTGKQERKKCRKLKLDIDKASKSMNNSINYSEDSSVNQENTPKQKLLNCESADHFKAFNFNQSFDISDVSVASSNEDIYIESLSEHSDTEVSDDNDKSEIKMCRKVEHQSMPVLLPSATPESFADVEIDQNEDEKVTLLLNYQMRLEKIESCLKELLTEFQFHIEVSKVFDSKPSETGSGVQDLNIKDIQRGISPTWNILEKESSATKTKLKKQLLTMRQSIDEFIDTHLQECKPKSQQNLTYDIHKLNCQRKPSLSKKKKLKHFDFPDLREAMISLFSADESENDCETSKCSCQCHLSDPETPKSDKVTPDQSITSSIGNFTLDSTTLSAYSESLDQIISYNSFETDSLYNSLLQKSAIERISFYIQVHSIQLKCNSDFESKNVITFYCPICKTTDCEENELMRHILSPSHCEKIHFVYKTAYVKKCISSGKEIQPSTVLNPMTMYRDDNKIVCFGDAMYACSLCFENLIVGESVLMSHCSEKEHLNRREMLDDDDFN